MQSNDARQPARKNFFAEINLRNGKEVRNTKPESVTIFAGMSTTEIILGKAAVDLSAGTNEITYIMVYKRMKTEMYLGSLILHALIPTNLVDVLHSFPRALQPVH